METFPAVSVASKTSYLFPTGSLSVSICITNKVFCVFFCGSSNYILLRHIGQLSVLLSSQAHWRMSQDGWLFGERETDIQPNMKPRLLRVVSVSVSVSFTVPQTRKCVFYLTLKTRSCLSIVSLVLEHVESVQHWPKLSKSANQTDARGPEDIRGKRGSSSVIYLAFNHSSF